LSQNHPTYDVPDVRLLRDRELLESPFPGTMGQDLRVYFTPQVYEGLCAHAAEDTTVEICGVLVGTWARDAVGAFVQITDAVRGESARNRFAEVTFTHETWARINEEMDKRFADRAIVGWYHTHPDFGVFLSDRDRFIQEHFFSGAGQIALVFDPVRRTVGAFAWRDGKATLCPYFWVGERVVLATAAGEEITPAQTSEEAGPARPSGSGTGEPLPRSWTTQALAYLALFLLGNMMASYRSSWEQTRLAEGAVAHYGVWGAMRPGLKEGLDTLEDRLQKLTLQVDSLSTDHLRRLQGEKDREALAQQWSQVRRALADTANLVAKLDRLYCLTPDERTAAEKLLLERLRSVRDPSVAAVPEPSEATSTNGSPVGPAATDASGEQSSPAAKPASPRPAASSK
jgi:proteasome lid subunit RPN8/RPN11